MIDRYQLRYFLAVVDQGNFSKAAQSCNVSQPTLSIGIAKLEKGLGANLFLRTNRRVQLTDAGAELLVLARRIEEGFCRAERSVGSAAAPKILRLGILVTTPSEFLTCFLRDHRTTRDGQRVEIVEGSVRELQEALSRGRIDVAFSVLRDEGTARQEMLFSEGYGLVLSAGHRLADRDSLSAESLIHEPMIVRRRCELLSETSRHFTARGVRPFFAARTTCDRRALDYVRSGIGITVMPDCFRLSGVTRIRLEHFTHRRALGLIYASHTDPQAVRQSETIEALVDASARLAAPDHVSLD